MLTSAPRLLRAIAAASEQILARGGGECRGKALDSANRSPDVSGPASLGPLETSQLTTRDAAWRWTQRADRVLRRTAGIGVPHRQRPDQRLPEGVGDASLVLAMGGGYVDDVDPTQARRTLDLLEYAVDRRIPAAMLGQGSGPLEDPDLLAHAQRVLPRVDFISLREGLHGPEFLCELGVMPGRVMVTGDAVDLAYGLRRHQTGAGLGVCLRRADYSPVADRARHCGCRSGAAGRGLAGCAAVSTDHLGVSGGGPPLHDATG